MRLQVKFKKPGLADCEVSIRAKGFLTAMLYWAIETVPIPGWSLIAAVPLDATGKGLFRFGGNRAIPLEATHLYARCITPDYAVIDGMSEKIPDEFKIMGKNIPPMFTSTLMSDLHLSGKSGRIARAFQSAESDVILLAGDLVNDGYTEQFALLKGCVEEKIPHKKLLSVTGNHDQLFSIVPNNMEDYKGYSVFQQYLLRRIRELGIPTETGPGGNYEVYVDKVSIIGLQCVDNNRKFVFPGGEQLEWLRRRLDQNDGWHIILCHAPLLKHNPQRNEGAPYLGRNDELQKIIDSHRKIIFVSGHTHVSPNNAGGCVESIYEKQLVYINDGSVTPTELKGEILMPAEWKDGVRMELGLWDDQVEIKTKSIHTGICYPRGYYRLCFGEK